MKILNIKYQYSNIIGNWKLEIENSIFWRAKNG